MISYAVALGIVHLSCFALVGRSIVRGAQAEARRRALPGGGPR